MTGAEKLIGREVVVFVPPKMQPMPGLTLEDVGASGVLCKVIANGRQVFFPWHAISVIVASGDRKGGDAPGGPVPAALRALWGEDDDQAEGNA